jgi:hypothetical protein
MTSVETLEEVADQPTYPTRVRAINPALPQTAIVAPRVIASSIGRFLEYSHFHMIELAFNIRCGAK